MATISLDDIILKKLVLVKQLYRQALLLSQKPNISIDGLLSVIIFDLAIETAWQYVNGCVNSRVPWQPWQEWKFFSVLNCGSPHRTLTNNSIHFGRLRTSCDCVF